MNLNETIKIAKKLIDLPYNKFNLDNYIDILQKNYGFSWTLGEGEKSPIQLMSGNHPNAGILNSSIKWLGKKRIFIIGKGILFDSGGMNLKPSRLSEMKNDKAGMIIALSIADYLKGNVIAYCPVTTNFIHTSKIIPGDEIKIGKKIVKVNNTDAEGRLILAEALSTLPQNKNDIIITIATLTGAVGYAIGDKATGIFAENEELLKKYAEASFEANELAWGLPLFAYMQEFYNNKTIRNSERKILAGASEGAMFIKQFVKYPENWIHLDIAYSAFDNITKKANGVPIKSLIKFIRSLQ